MIDSKKTARLGFAFLLALAKVTSGGEVVVYPFPHLESEALQRSLQSGVYGVRVGPSTEVLRESFVGFTSVANRQRVVSPFIPSTNPLKATSFTNFDTEDSAFVQIRLLDSRTSITQAQVLPSSSGIRADVIDGVAWLVIDRPRQVCVVVNGHMDHPLCLFANPLETFLPLQDQDVTANSSSSVKYFGAGVHYAGAIAVGAGETVYLAGGAIVFGQVVQAKECSSPCHNVSVRGRGVLSGHLIPINSTANAMVHCVGCPGLLIEGITTLDSPQHQVSNYWSGGVIRWAKAIAWGFSTDGWAAGQHSLVEDSFVKVNDDSTKGYFTGSLVQRMVIWQMENGCPFMLSWNIQDNVGFITFRDSDVIAHERPAQWYNPDGIICAVHGGQGNINNVLFDSIRIENARWAFLSITIQPNAWSPANGQGLGQISNIILRDVSAAARFPSPTPIVIRGFNESVVIESVYFDNVTIGGANVKQDDFEFEFVHDIHVCALANCTANIVGQGWTLLEKCGEAPQPSIRQTAMEPLSHPRRMPYCASVQDAADGIDRSPLIHTRSKNDAPGRPAGPGPLAALAVVVAAMAGSPMLVGCM